MTITSERKSLNYAFQKLAENGDQKIKDALNGIGWQQKSEEELKILFHSTHLNGEFRKVLGKAYDDVEKDIGGTPGAPTTTTTTTPAAGIDTTGGIMGFLGTALPAYFLSGGNLMAAAKAGLAGAGIAGTFDNWDQITAGLKPFLDQLGPVGAQIGGLLTGGAGGVGEFLGNAGSALGNIFGGEQMQHILGMAKENPLATIAMVVAAGMAFNSGKGIFGSLFEFGKLALIMLAVTWVAENYLGVGGNKTAAIDHSMGGDSVAATNLPAPAVAVQVS